MEREPPQPARRLDDARIPEELRQKAPDRGRSGGVRGAEIHQQRAGGRTTAVLVRGFAQIGSHAAGSVAERIRELHLNRGIPQVARFMPLSRIQRTKPAKATGAREGKRPDLSLSNYRKCVRVIREAFARTRTIWGTQPGQGRPSSALSVRESGLESSCPLYRGSRSLLPPPRDRVSFERRQAARNSYPAAGLDGGRQCQGRSSLRPGCCRPLFATYRSTIAVTPIPPAVQMEIESAPAATGREQFRQRRENARTGCGKRMPDRNTSALHIHLAAIDRAERLREPEPLAAELRRLPRLERAQHLRFERLVDFVEVEVLQSSCPHRRACAAPRTPAPSASLPC